MKDMTENVPALITLCSGGRDESTYMHIDARVISVLKENEAGNMHDKCYSRSGPMGHSLGRDLREVRKQAMEGTQAGTK